MIQTFKLTIEYDGTGFSGWQRQADMPTIQGELESVLGIILNQKIALAGSGRTDAGVHAMGQVASFRADTAMDPQRLQKGANSLMKHPIVIRECAIVSNGFHARFAAVSKQYQYHILNRQEPCAVGRNYIWHIQTPLDVDAMNACCRYMCGVHDFTSFENTGSPRRSAVREVFFARVEKQKDSCLVFMVCANGFLKNMVRNMVGTLVDAGKQKITPEAFESILSGRNRRLAGATAPARGLFLTQVNYAGN
jgi:tRNA pseudouridine38-40 synthase